MAALTPSPDVSPVSLTNGYFAGDSFPPPNSNSKHSVSPVIVTNSHSKTKRSVKLATGTAPHGHFRTRLTVNGKVRTMSQSSSTDRELSTEVVGQQTGQSTDEPRPNPRKRQNSDTVDYPRRRATIACEICRSRKSRCDGNRPKCRLCTELNAECIYREPGIKLDAGDKLILQHLNRIEGLIATNMLANSRGNSPIMAAYSPPSSVNGSEHGQVPPRSLNGSDLLTSRSGSNASAGIGMTPLPLNGLGTWNHSTSNISTMPRKHTTPALHLLKWPMIENLVSRPYDPQVLLQEEMGREPLNLEPPQSLNLNQIDKYAHAFFERVNIWYACVNPYSWRSYLAKARGTGFRQSGESCVVLLVAALGSAGLAGSMSQQPPNAEAPGLPCFAAAWAMLPSLMTRNNTLSAQCHILASAYLFYIVRPLEAWSLLTNTSMKLQLLLSGPRQTAKNDREMNERVYWNTLMFESDLLAEMDLPHSGIVQFEETVGLPVGFESEDVEPAGKDELWYFLAEIALRRLLNRVSHLIYTKNNPHMSTAALEPIVLELDRQLTQWYENLPMPVRFPHDRVELSSPIQTVLRLRYFACRTIIFRPYILLALRDESSMQDLTVQECCRKCLESCIRQLDHIREHHAGHIPYLWQGALSMVSQTLLIMGATLSPSLSKLLPPQDQMDGIIEDVLREINRYAHLAPSMQLSADILREADLRRHMMRDAQQRGLKRERAGFV
ncbi:hypothetical protein K402DRAFT_406780 [Aulographum hederae CBS 113979]|uniref:Zn(2)-C6 fungal-type domain-containing protein n=1 Tax=Aulographum hederae CBS 113979 TaxID=1176131 RepID=A0A6G1GRW9_9PEZI|nr:hypothetical protein K402DRAFT_406780 [Aulographum hederae CBS 113979]